MNPAKLSEQPARRLEHTLGHDGQYTDPETGLIYLRARYYDPGTGQFLTRDPLNAVTRSAYGYVAGNPLNGTDPSGLNWLSDTISQAVSDPVGSFTQGWNSMSTAAKIADATLPITLPAAVAACWFGCPGIVAAGSAIGGALAVTAETYGPMAAVGQGMLLFSGATAIAGFVATGVGVGIDIYEHLRGCTKTNGGDRLIQSGEGATGQGGPDGLVDPVPQPGVYGPNYYGNRIP